MRLFRHLLAVLAVIICAPIQASSLELTVNIHNLKSNEGFLKCALFSRSEGFPMNEKLALDKQRLTVAGQNATCKFNNLEPGEYAVAVTHDENSNDKIDKNMLGIPKEDWGVSNNVRPKMRGPKFYEASFSIDDSMKIDISLD